MEKSGDQFVLREFMYGDYEMVKKWWDDPPPRQSIPKVGLVSGDMKAMGFLVNTDTDFGIITWWHANPENKGRESHTALKRIICGLSEIGYLIGKKKIFIYTNNRGMIRLLESLGFVNHDGHLMKEMS